MPSRRIAAPWVQLMNVRLTVAAAILATGPLVALGAAANATDNYQDTVRQALHNAGYEVTETWGPPTS
jgi:hypothetical protein